MQERTNEERDRNAGTLKWVEGKRAGQAARKPNKRGETANFIAGSCTVWVRWHVSEERREKQRGIRRADER